MPQREQMPCAVIGASHQSVITAEHPVSGWIRLTIGKSARQCSSRKRSNSGRRNSADAAM